MDAATQAQVFDPFFTLKPAGRGSGLGLATVYGIVQQNGGFIWVYSEPGAGTTFKVYLPRVDEAPTPRPQPPVGAAQGGTETILLVEDHDIVREILTELLSGLGYHVLGAASGEEALAIAARTADEIALLLTDVKMPGMNGRDLARQLAESRPAMRVLYMSGYTAGAVSQQGILDEGVALVEKPVPASKLAARVREVLDAPEAPTR
jgi:CheY-like chemotaxis protein